MICRLSWMEESFFGVRIARWWRDISWGHIEGKIWSTTFDEMHWVGRSIVSGGELLTLVVREPFPSSTNHEENCCWSAWARMFFVNLNCLMLGQMFERLMQFSMMAAREPCRTTGNTWRKSPPMMKSFPPKRAGEFVMSCSILFMAWRAWMGSMDASSMMNSVISRNLAACLDVGCTLHVLVSVMGTGSLKRLWTVWPPDSKVAAIPVHAVAATWKAKAYYEVAKRRMYLNNMD